MDGASYIFIWIFPTVANFMQGSSLLRGMHLRREVMGGSRCSIYRPGGQWSEECVLTRLRDSFSWLAAQILSSNRVLTFGKPSLWDILASNYILTFGKPSHTNFSQLPYLLLKPWNLFVLSRWSMMHLQFMQPFQFKVPQIQSKLFSQ